VLLCDRFDLRLRHSLKILAVTSSYNHFSSEDAPRGNSLLCGVARGDENGTYPFASFLHRARESEQKSSRSQIHSIIRPPPYGRFGYLGITSGAQSEEEDMSGTKRTFFDPAPFLEATGIVHRMIEAKPGHIFFSQGDLTDSIFFLDSGRAKLTVVSKRGKEATVTLVVPGDFIGEESLAGGIEVHDATATAVTSCRALKLTRKEMILLLHEQHEFSDIFLKFVLLRSVRTREDLIDQLFNNSEKRLARTLLIMADFGQPDEPETLIPPVTQEELADMIGTTRSRVSKFMNNFRKLGYISYNGRIHVHKALLNVVLHDRLPHQTASRPVVIDHDRTPIHLQKTAKFI
jgi:CRP/FNR family cyclic AMP-dependent transcriptional regulator